MINKIRLYLRQRGIRYTIPRKVNERRGGKFDKALYRMRNLVERCFNCLKQYRALCNSVRETSRKLPGYADYSLYYPVVIVLKHALVVNIIPPKIEAKAAPLNKTRCRFILLVVKFIVISCACRVDIIFFSGL